MSANNQPLDPPEVEVPENLTAWQEENSRLIAALEVLINEPRLPYTHGQQNLTAPRLAAPLAPELE